MNVGFLHVLKTKLTLYTDNGTVFKEPSLLHFCFNRNMKILLYIFVNVFIWTKFRKIRKKKRLQHINRMPCNKLLRILKYYRPTGRKNQLSPLKRP